jgi:hypothetical protein
VQHFPQAPQWLRELNELLEVEVANESWRFPGGEKDPPRDQVRGRL